MTKETSENKGTKKETFLQGIITLNIFTSFNKVVRAIIYFIFNKQIRIWR